MGSVTLLPMRIPAALLLTAFLALAPTAHAAGDAGDDAALDTLFSQLKRSGNEAAANKVARSITEKFSQSGSATVSFLMGRADEAMAKNENGLALDLLDQVVMLEPGFAEGWNRRATLHYKMGNHVKSVADITETLKLQPRHFGALSGLAAIFMATGREESALKVYEQVLDIYPMMRNAQTAVGTLADKLAGEGI